MSAEHLLGFGKHRIFSSLQQFHCFFYQLLSIQFHMPAGCIIVRNIKTNIIKVKICIILPRHKSKTDITKIRPVLYVIKPRSYMQRLLRKSYSFQI